MIEWERSYKIPGLNLPLIHCISVYLWNEDRRIVVEIKWENISKKKKNWKALGNKHIQNATMMGKVNKGKKGKLHKGLRKWKYRAIIINRPCCFRGFTSVWCSLSYEINENFTCLRPTLRSLMESRYLTRYSDNLCWFLLDF